MSQITTPTKKLHSAHDILKEAPDEKKLVRLYNKGEGALKHDIRLEDGTVIGYEIKGQSFERVPKTVADLWLRDFPDRIVTDDEAQKLVAGANAEADKLREELAKANLALAAARSKSDPKGELARVQKALEEANEKNASLQADLEKATAPAPEAGSGV